MVNNPLQFAVVREDPQIELEIVKRLPANCNIFLIGSGGCTALTLRNEYPRASIMVLDPNPAQIALIHKKIVTLQNPDIPARKNAFGVGIDDPNSLTGSGNFESLFRSLRNFIFEFVLDGKDWVRLFTRADSARELRNQIFTSKYWPIAFQLSFSDPLLLAMFGRNAIQYAPCGSYPAYFQHALESGLVRADANRNYFLHHIFLGHYIDVPDCLPNYLTASTSIANDFSFVEALAQNGPHYGQFDVISLSNIFDWMDRQDVIALTQRLVKEMKPGAWIIFRQLNNSADVRSQLEPSVQFDDRLATDLLKHDRSLFYSRISTGQKVSH